MEYSLNNLNLISTLNQLTLTEFINSLNLIGLEIDEVTKKVQKSNYSLSNIKILVKIPSNRQDLLIEHFFVEEISTIFLFKLLKHWAKIKQNYKFLLRQKYEEYYDYSFNLINSEFDCLVTYVFELKNFKNLSSPLWLRNKLSNNGIEILNNYTDIINLVMFEWGQSLNFITILNYKNDSTYKIERLNDKEIFIDNLGKKSELFPGSIVLKDNKNKIVTTLGFLNINTSNSLTNKVFIESTFYDIDQNPLLIELINPKVSLKYFRKMFLENFKFCFQRLLTLTEILEYSFIAPIKYSTKKQNLLPIKNKILSLQRKSLKNILSISKIDENIFKKAGLNIICKTPTEIFIKIPNYRKDLLREIDVIEEYSRFLGYKNFEEIIPSKKMNISSKYSDSIEFLKQYFLNSGFNEVITNSIHEITDTSIEVIKISNPLNKDLSILRTTFLDKLLELFINNSRLSSLDNNLFEIGRVFQNKNNKVIEKNMFGAIFQLRNNNLKDNSSHEWFLALGFIENFLESYGYQNLTKKNIENSLPYYHPTRSIELKYKNEIIGTFGQISPLYGKFSSLKKITYFIELNLYFFKNYRRYTNPTIYSQYSKYPSITKDLSCLIQKDTNFKKLKIFLQDNLSFLKSVSFFDIYFNKQDINLGIRFEFQCSTNTLTTEYVEKEIEKIKKLLSSEWNIKLPN
jgi:phenylalanyl-tRNA synthetase beta chain